MFKSTRRSQLYVPDSAAHARPPPAPTFRQFHRDCHWRSSSVSACVRSSSVCFVYRLRTFAKRSKVRRIDSCTLHMTGCSAPNCTNRTGNGKAFYAVPCGRTDVRRRLKWLLRMGRDRPAPKGTRICELPPQHNNGDEDGIFSRGVTAHNFFAMSCIGLIPPPPFLPVPGRPPVPWPQWHQMFENFLLASGVSDFKPERRKALLIHSLGVEGQRVFASLLLTSAASQSDDPEIQPEQPLKDQHLPDTQES
ncbi:hypothetical protein HPB50_015093 [Hyalomma asiaticum]|uniref:Uncharacterized protein n=1 Tax=Hyalomma asiaticum TaxID=266040 RepID=A0ACB7RPT5_HYAAI|nr:hypothetical protein HPB50_015093 [Hyalomma asiaticum]